MRRLLADLLTKNIEELMPLLNNVRKDSDLDSNYCRPPVLSTVIASRADETCPNADSDAWLLFPSIINCTAMEQQNCTDTDNSDIILSASGGIESVGVAVRIWRRSLLSCADSAVHAVPYALRASVLQEIPKSNSNTSHSETAMNFVQKTLNFTRSDCLWSYPYSASRGAFLFELFASIGILLTTVRCPSFLFPVLILMRTHLRFVLMSYSLA
jgi:hypothetical protein